MNRLGHLPLLSRGFFYFIFLNFHLYVWERRSVYEYYFSKYFADQF